MEEAQFYEQSRLENENRRAEPTNKRAEEAQKYQDEIYERNLENEEEVIKQDLFYQKN